ncbi:hypothetical protein EV44_g3488 [Erysiphe necator]|uniref:Uncharacterized protein n=1 Tax=Uncinula necator TaxID=52586 RepID=A0A0B1NZQ9_UNCNE|nr:hypothetical protein EV44_g3488 [Erysiphe necator]
MNPPPPPPSSKNATTFAPMSENSYYQKDTINVNLNKSSSSPQQELSYSSHPIQFFDQPLNSSPNERDPDDSINLYRPLVPKLGNLTYQERFNKRYFPDIFLRADAENPDGPLREASRRNRAVFPPGCKLKDANADSLDSLNLMQVCMIQAMLPYSALSSRVAIEMEDDFVIVRRLINNYSFDWASTVEAILKVLNENGALGSPLRIFARLTPKNTETAVKFARCVRKSFFLLPMDVSLGPNAREVLINHIEPSLPQTDQIANRVVHFTQQASRADLQGKFFQPYSEPKLLPTSIDNYPPNVIQNSSSLVIATPEEPSFLALQSNECRIYRRKGHWAKDCTTKNNPKDKHRHSPKTHYKSRPTKDKNYKKYRRSNRY